VPKVNGLDFPFVIVPENDVPANVKPNTEDPVVFPAKLTGSARAIPGSINTRPTIMVRKTALHTFFIGDYLVADFP
jgi:hypothetical protein